MTVQPTSGADPPAFVVPELRPDSDQTTQPGESPGGSASVSPGAVIHRSPMSPVPLLTEEQQGQRRQSEAPEDRLKPLHQELQERELNGKGPEGEEGGASKPPEAPAPRSSKVRRDPKAPRPLPPAGTLCGSLGAGVLTLLLGELGFLLLCFGTTLYQKAGAWVGYTVRQAAVVAFFGTWLVLAQRCERTGAESTGFWCADGRLDAWLPVIVGVLCAAAVLAMVALCMSWKYVEVAGRVRHRERERERRRREAEEAVSLV